MALPRLASTVAQVRGTVSRHAERVGRDPATVRIVAVTKQVPVELVREALAAGIALVGENRVQEALAKQAELPQLTGRMHLVGHLQANKVKKAVGAFALLHGVDDLPLARAVAAEATRQDRVQPVLAQVNVAGEATKHGLAPDQARAVLAEMLALPGLAVQGLMTIAPRSEDPEAARPVFRALRGLRDELQQDLGAELPELSMGMSADYPVAVEEGATLVRIGQALFGPRPEITPPSHQPFQEDA